MVLGGEYVTGRPAHFGAEFEQGFDQHAGLDGHVDTTQYLGPARACCPGTWRASPSAPASHLGDVQFPAAPVGQGDIGDFVVLFGLYFLAVLILGSLRCRQLSVLVVIVFCSVRFFDARLIGGIPMSATVN